MGTMAIVKRIGSLYRAIFITLHVGRSYHAPFIETVASDYSNGSGIDCPHKRYNAHL